MLEWLHPITDGARFTAFGIIFIAVGAVCLYGIVVGDAAVQDGRGKKFLGMPTRRTIEDEWNQRIAAGDTRAKWVRRCGAALWLAGIVLILWPSSK